MKIKRLFTAALFFLALQLNAAEPIRWGVVAGMNVSKPAKASYDERVGFHVGGEAEIKFSDKVNGFYLNPMLLFSMKGGKPSPYYYEDVSGKIENVERNYFLNLPIHAGYKHAVSQKVALLGTLGPYMGLGLFGKVKQKIDGHSNGSEKIYGSNGYLRRFDWGLSGKVGVEFIKKFQVSVGYELGLKNMAKTGDYKNRNFMVSCAYMF